MRSITPEAIASLLPPGSTQPRIVTSGNGAVPWTSVRALDATLPEFRLHLLNPPSGIPDREGITLETAFVGPGMRRSPRLSYFPCRLSRVPLLFHRHLPVDLALVHTSAPIDGRVSLGTEVNILPGLIEATKAAGGLVVAQVNPRMPYTYGDGEIDLDAFDAVVEVDEPLATLPVHAASTGEQAESAQVIGGLVASRISDGATLQMGIGEIPDATLACLLGLKNLGIWTEMLADGVLALDDADALDPDPDRPIVSSFVFGSEELYRWVHRNDRVRILRTETTNSPARIATNPGMTSINTALQVDLLDQANASRIHGRIHSGFGGQTDFTVGATHAPGGQAIMALRSWHPKANVSTIVPLLSEPVTSFQHTAVVTEHGVAEIEGCDEKHQAANLITHAAHPRVRDELWEEARGMGLA